MRGPFSFPNQKLIRFLTQYRTMLLTILLISLWFAVYTILESATTWVSFTLLHLSAVDHFGATVAFFLYESPKVLLLLTLVAFVVGVIRTFFTPERTRRLLAGKRESTGNVLSAMLGIVTPFCSCSAVPLFIGFVATGVPLGVTFSFLIAAPMINEVALVLLLGLFGWKIALLYISTGLFIAIAAGWIIGRLHLERYIESWVFETKMKESKDSSLSLSWDGRIHQGYQSMAEIVGNVWPYLLAGIGIGAGIHGYVPTNLMASIMGKSAWWSVPLAVIIGIPMYSNAAGIIPVIQALLEKGAALGTVLAFMMSVIGLSFPETVILRKVLKLPLIITFVGVVAIGILLVGFLFNMLPLQAMSK